MRIVIDLQGAQSHGSRNRGIGRYSIALTRAIIRNAGAHEILIVLNNAFPETIEPIKAQFADVLTPDQIRVFQSLTPVARQNAENDCRRIASELCREAFIASLAPDLVHICSPMEGLTDDAVASIGTFYTGVTTTATIYDLIPLIHSEVYLRDPGMTTAYHEALDNVRRADMLLAISQSSADEAIEHLGFPPSRSVDIGTAADDFFRKIHLSAAQKEAVLKRYGFSRPFLMYTGGNDFRKNIEALIRAFAALPAVERKKYQLAIVCAFNDPDRVRLNALAKEHGLPPDALVLTGFVSDDDLLSLYNLCKLFVFPSWHEGFGLPILEAMHCGAPAIGSNCSSIPEVIGWEEALFDPRDDHSIRDMILKALTDDEFMSALTAHCARQCQTFSWDVTGKKAVDAFERLYSERKPRPTASPPATRLKLAFVSPLPPTQSGIADYSRLLIESLSRYYDIEAVVEAKDLTKTDPIETEYGPVPIITVEQLSQNYSDYQRILYQVGNSEYHDEIRSLSNHLPGVTVLHDFYLSGLARYQAYWRNDRPRWLNDLYEEHGLSALYRHLNAENEDDVLWDYPCCASIARHSKAVIVHSEYNRRLAAQWLGNEEAARWTIVPHLRATPVLSGNEAARKHLNLPPDASILCCFGIVGPMKCNLEVLRGWLASNAAADPNAMLLFVGKNDDGDYGEELLDEIKASGLGDRIRVTGWADEADFHAYLQACDVAIQLRTLSRGETSGVVLHSMSYAIPTIVNANGSMAEIPDDGAYCLPDKFTLNQLTGAINALHDDPGLRQRIGNAARDIIAARHSPEACARAYYERIEKAYEVPSLPDAIVHQRRGLTLHELGQLAPIVVASTTHPVSKNLYIDVSVLALVDAKSGIQRVVRSILHALIKRFRPGLRIEPIYYVPEQGLYRFARQFSRSFIGQPEEILGDDVVEFARGDVFLGLDLCQNFVIHAEGLLKFLRNIGVEIHFVVYDLLPLSLPDYFPDEVPAQHERWLKVIAQMDSAICISQAVADEMPVHLDALDLTIERPLAINWFHLGSDLQQSLPTRGLPANAAGILEKLRLRPSFLSVGTLEPRKAQADLLAAFDTLWRSGQDVNLVLVGKEGWRVERLVRQLRTHPELGKRLFWLKGISDEYLDEVYAACSCLVAASLGEGFGLPLIEAAQHGLPVLARDVPVFREVLGASGTYFAKEANANAIAEAVQAWIDAVENRTTSLETDIRAPTWDASSEALLNAIFQKETPYRMWRKDVE
ncbi:glycosyltransferase involved in cell wall biosynthesis [Sphingobium xanthum]|uniref:glycosyltransferase n=1 Tax=Sphingobium xanthum TaxID=1387165 RepID=UPI001C8C1B94|nr:glycosyltransferase [Sphingobium xanthum]